MRSMVEGACVNGLPERLAPLPPRLPGGPPSRFAGQDERHRKSLRMILPTLLLGNESTNTITFGTL